MQGGVWIAWKVKEEIWEFYFNIQLFWLFQLKEATPLTWGWGFIGGPTAGDPQSEGESNVQSGYHSAETAIISDSEDDLFFLNGELATTCHFKSIIVNNKVEDQGN